MSKNVGILIFDEAEVLDFAGPFEVFSVTSQLNDSRPFSVFTISKDEKIVSAVNGLKVKGDYTLEDHPPIDILIISGGQGTRKLMLDREILAWISHIQAQAELTLSICSASRLVGKLGLLDHKPFCTHHEVYDHMRDIAPLGIPQKEERFVQTSERLYTSGGISAGIDLSLHIVEKLLGKDLKEKTMNYMEYFSNYQTSAYEKAL